MDECPKSSNLAYVDSGKLARLRLCERQCPTCRYYREHTTGATVSCCLLLGRDLAGTDGQSGVSVHQLSVGRLCDGWKRRPKAWLLSSKGVNAWPYWVDPYISRPEQARLRTRFLKAQLRKGLSA